jgi:quercetin dioxygenase-like cupin family protein
MKMEQAKAVLRVDNDDVTVTEWQFAPGSATGEHRHGYDYVVVPLTAGTLRITSALGESFATLAPGAAYSRKAGVEHNVINSGDDYLAFVEIELKRQPG